MSITIKKIWHREAFRIGIFFDYDAEKIKILKAIGGQFSKTHACWYIDYDVTSYAKLKQQFRSFTIESPKDFTTTPSVTGMSRDLSPIALSESQLDLSKTNNPEHKTDIDSFIPNLKLELLENIGKYWVFKMRYHQGTSKALLTIKGVYWNPNYRCYMALRNPKVKEAVEHVLKRPSFLSDDFVSKDTSYRGACISIHPHHEDLSWMEIHVPKLVAIHEKLKRFSMVRYSKTKDCYLLPAAPIVYESIQLQMEPLEVEINNELPLEYLQKKHLPNKKRLDLSKTKQSLLEQIPETGRNYVMNMIDNLLALNYSNATMRTYTNAFIQFLRHFNYRDPETITPQEIVRFLGSLMQRGLTASTGHSMVNS
ncbi:phage integrase N-terminal SAM-like domain-containing protein, partial [Flavobacterium sp.]